MAGGLALLSHGEASGHGVRAAIVALRLSSDMPVPCCRRLETRLPRLPCRVCAMWPTLSSQVLMLPAIARDTIGEHNGFSTDGAELKT